MEYDFLTRFGVGLEVVGDEWSWGRALRMVNILRADPSSALAAALEGWDHPITREALILMDLFDLEHAVNAKKKPKPHPGRPWSRDDEPATRQRGDAAGRSPEEMKALLRTHFGQPEAPI